MSQFRPPAGTPSRSAVDGDRNLKPPKAPEKPLVPYMRFSRKMWAKVRADNPDAQLWDIGKVIGQMWRDTAENDKQVYQQEYENEKVEYDKAMKQYQNSPAYQQYLQARNRQKQSEKMSRNRAMDAGGVVIQPVDEDESHNEMTFRKVAHTRYERNQRLMAELFNSQIVNDTRTIVGQSRIEMLRKQAQSLASHQQKLEDELRKLDETFEAKKRAIEKGSESFAEQLKKVCEEKPVLDDSKFQEFVTKWEGELSVAYVDYKKKQDEIAAKAESDRAALAENSTLFAMVAENDDESKEKEEQEPERNEEEKAPEESEVTTEKMDEDTLPKEDADAKPEESGDSNQAPSQEEETLAEEEETLAEEEETLAEGEETLAEGEETLAEGEEIPMEEQETPIEEQESQ